MHITPPPPAYATPEPHHTEDVVVIVHIKSHDQALPATLVCKASVHSVPQANPAIPTLVMWEDIRRWSRAGGRRKTRRCSMGPGVAVDAFKSHREGPLMVLLIDVFVQVLVVDEPVEDLPKR